MSNFKEFQFGTIVLAITIPINILIVALYITQAGNNPMTPISLSVAIGVMLLVCLLFYGMTTTVDRDRIRISYGIGLIRKSIRIENVKSATVVTTPWYYGWGIRFIPNGMLYNINGSSGLELILKDTSRVIRIGSANASLLRAAIEKEIK